MIELRPDDLPESQMKQGRSDTVNLLVALELKVSFFGDLHSEILLSIHPLPVSL